MYVFCHDLDGSPFSFECDGLVSLKEQIEKRTSLPAGSFRVVSANGGRLELLSSALNVVSLRLGLCGGKGGFGSLLRGGNTSVNRKKSSNYDSSRDLSGRRLLHISNERKLAEWFAGSESREMEAKGADFLKRMEREKQMVEFESHFKEQSDRVKDMIAGALDTLDPAVIASLGPEKKNKNKRDREDAPVSLSNSSEGRPRKRFCTGLDELDTDVLDEEDDVDQTETPSEVPDQKKSSSSPETPSSDSMTPSPPLTTSPDPVEKTEENKGIDLSRFESAKDLEALGLEALKNELTRLGLLCGGTLEQRATRLFSTKNKKPSEFDPSIIAKKKPVLRKF